MISVSELTKSYSGNLAVDHLSFEVDEGQVYGLLGPNGAGKSTTMNILTGYISATSGTVKIDGTDILEEPEKAKAKIPEGKRAKAVYMVDGLFRELMDLTARDRAAKIKPRVRITKKSVQLLSNDLINEGLIVHLEDAPKETEEQK